MVKDMINLSINVVCLSPSFDIVHIIKVVKFSFNKISEVVDFGLDVVISDPLLDLEINRICSNKSVNLVSKSLNLGSNFSLISLINVPRRENNWLLNSSSTSVCYIFVNMIDDLIDLSINVVGLSPS